MDAHTYHDWLNSRLEGLSNQELRDLCDILIDRVRGLQEPSVILSAETVAHAHTFAETVTAHVDNMPAPTQEQFDYFYAKALHISYDLEELGQLNSIVWSWFGENANRNRFSEAQEQKIAALRMELYYNDGLESLCLFRDRPPEDCDKCEHVPEPTDDAILEQWREFMGF